MVLGEVGVNSWKDKATGEQRQDNQVKNWARVDRPIYKRKPPPTTDIGGEVLARAEPAPAIPVPATPPGTAGPSPPTPRRPTPPCLKRASWSGWTNRR
jgi:hypothetical protein